MEKNRNIRAQSLGVATKAGVNVAETLPLLDGDLDIRETTEVVNRLLAMHAIAAAASGFQKEKALAWVRQEELVGVMTASEVKFLVSGEGNPSAFLLQIEGMYALAWALSMTQQFDFWRDCDNRFVAILPNLLVGQSGDKWHREAKMRIKDEIFAALDLAYCLHWSVRQAELDGKAPPARLKAYVVVERRRAFEWLLGEESWDAVSLDT